MRTVKIVFDDGTSGIWNIVEENIGLLKLKSKSSKFDTFVLEKFINNNPAYLIGELSVSEKSLLWPKKCKLYFLNSNNEIISAHHKHK